VSLLDVGRPFRVRLAWDLPFFPGGADGRVEAGTEWFKRLPCFVPQDINFRIVGDGLQGDVMNCWMSTPSKRVAPEDARRDSSTALLQLYLLLNQSARLALLRAHLVAQGRGEMTAQFDKLLAAAVGGPVKPARVREIERLFPLAFRIAD
jgi:hypothetical protein